MKKLDKARMRRIVLIVIILPIFVGVSFFATQTIDAHKKDFAAYWQAGHMILTGQNIYNPQEWDMVRSIYKTAFHSEPTFQYPLPFAIFMAPLALFFVQDAYTLWVFFALVAILASILILSGFYPDRSMYLELAAVAGIFLFRPVFIVIFNGQILPPLLFSVALAIFFFRKEKWFIGGFILTILGLKPSIGIPILVLVGFWLIIKKRWTALAGMGIGAILLFLIGALYNPHWVIDYLSIGQNSFSKYNGLQATLWGLAGMTFQENSWKLLIGAILACGTLALEGYFLARKKVCDEPFAAMATILPAGLLAAPYSWAYDQILLIVSMIYILICIAKRWGDLKAILYITGILIFTIMLVFLADYLGRDVWSLLIAVVLWISTLYFASQPKQSTVS
jgi:hypothetical protein